MNRSIPTTSGPNPAARLLRGALFALLLVALVPACQDASDPLLDSASGDGDVYIMFQGEVFDAASGLLPAEVVGEMAYRIQEGVHDRITDVSGAEIDYYYIWVCVGSDCVPVDPFRFGN